MLTPLDVNFKVKKSRFFLIGKNIIFARINFCGLCEFTHFIIFARIHHSTVREKQCVRTHSPWLVFKILGGKNSVYQTGMFTSTKF